VGQSSLEFLSGYGWAVIVAAVAIYVFAQSGVLNPAGRFHPTFLGFWGIVPTDCYYDVNGDLVLSFQNQVKDGDVNITELNVTDGGVSYRFGMNQRLTEGNVYKLVLFSSVTGLKGGSAGDGYKLIVSVDYVDNNLASGDRFRSAGTITGNIEKEPVKLGPTTTFTTTTTAPTTTTTLPTTTTTSTTTTTICASYAGSLISYPDASSVRFFYAFYDSYWGYGSGMNSVPYNDNKVITKVSLPGSYDFTSAGSTHENTYYDLYYSNADGSFNANGAYLTIDCYSSNPGCGCAVDGVSLQTMYSVDTWARSVVRNSGYVNPSNLLGAAQQSGDCTTQTYYATSSSSGSKSITVDFCAP